jgi:DNA-directed RNA polymerase specialized sigma24 family protein
VLTAETFDGLLAWLDRDREQAGQMYEEIRLRLIRRFRQLGCLEPEECANETIDRVAKKLPDIIATYKGDPEPYFYAFAHYVYMEYLRKPTVVPLPPTELPLRDAPTTTAHELFDEDEFMDACLRHCMEKLSERDREMILQYYSGERQVKIKLRKELADRLGIKLANLRLRAQRVRAGLKDCILDCMNRKAMA